MWTRIFLEKDQYQASTTLKVFSKNFGHRQRNKYCTEHKSYRKTIAEQNYRWLLVETFFSQSLLAFDFLFYIQGYNISKSFCIWFLILHTRIRYYRESRVVNVESFSTELKESIVHTRSAKRYFRNIGGTYALFNRNLNRDCLV